MRSTSANKKYSSAKPKFGAQQIFPRAALHGQVLIHDDEHLFIAPVNNLSAGGMFIEQLINIPSGREVKLVLKSDQLTVPIQAHGTVVRVERGGRRGLAVQFIGLDSAAKETIESFVLEARVESALKVA